MWLIRIHECFQIFISYSVRTPFLDIVSCVHCAHCIRHERELVQFIKWPVFDPFFFHQTHAKYSSLVYRLIALNLYSLCNWSDLICNEWRFKRRSSQFNGLSFSWHSKWWFAFFLSCHALTNLIWASTQRLPVFMTQPQ